MRSSVMRRKVHAAVAVCSRWCCGKARGFGGFGGFGGGNFVDEDGPVIASEPAAGLEMAALERARAAPKPRGGRGRGGRRRAPIEALELEAEGSPTQHMAVSHRV